MRKRKRPLNCKNSSNTTALRSNAPKPSVLALGPSSVAQKKKVSLLDKPSFSKQLSFRSTNLDHKSRLRRPNSTKANSNVPPFSPFATALDEDGCRYLLVAIPDGPPAIVAVDDIASGIRQLMKRGAPLASSSSVAAFRQACDKMIGSPPIARVLTMPGFLVRLKSLSMGKP